MFILAHDCRPWLAALFLSVFLVACGAQTPRESASASVSYPQAVAEELKALEDRLGAPLDLTVDPSLQRAVENALRSRGKPGAALVVDAKRGWILALDEVRGTRSRPLTEAIHPASTVKTLLALAGLREGVLSFEEKIACNGQFREAGEELSCFAPHGELNLERALATSCNVFFLEVAARLGVDRVAAHFSAFGFGEATGIELAESKGTVPDREWYSAHGGYREEDALASSIGHGSLAVTPLQLARAYVGVATGRLPRLTLLRSTGEKNVPQASRLPYGEELLAKIRRTLRTVVEGEEGTGRAAAVAGLSIAGKTGTADIPSSVENAEPSLNGWFVGFSPVEDPRVVVLVFVEGGGGGGQSAAPIAREIFKRVGSPE